MPNPAVGMIGATVGSAILGSQAAGDAADAQIEAAKQAGNTELAMFNQNRADMAPWRDTGVKGLNKLAELMGVGGNKYIPGTGTTTYRAPTYQDILAYNLARGQQRGDADVQWAQIQRGEMGSNEDIYNRYKAAGYEFPDAVTIAPGPQSPGTLNPDYGALTKKFSMEDFEADPGYGFRLKEGLKAIEQSAAARGLLQSGANLKGINRYAQDSASGEYTNAFNRFQLDQANKFNRFAALSGIGQTAAQQLGNQGMMTAQSIGNNQLAAGNAAAAGQVGSVNAFNNSLSQGVNFYNQNRMLDILQNQPNKNAINYSPYGSYPGIVYGTSYGE